MCPHLSFENQGKNLVRGPLRVKSQDNTRQNHQNFLFPENKTFTVSHFKSLFLK